MQTQNVKLTTLFYEEQKSGESHTLLVRGLLFPPVARSIPVTVHKKQNTNNQHSRNLLPDYDLHTNTTKLKTCKVAAQNVKKNTFNKYNLENLFL